MTEPVPRQDYTVTKRAGPKVAGRRASPGETLSLLPAEAEFDLGEGSLVLAGQDLSPAFETDEASDRARAEAAAFRSRAPQAEASPAVEPPVRTSPRRQAPSAADAGDGARPES